MDIQTPAPVPATAPIAQNASTYTDVWPGAFGIYKVSKGAVMLNLVPILSLIGINLAVSIVIGILTPKNTAVTGSSISYSTNTSNLSPLNFVGYAVSLVTTVVLIVMIMASLRGQKTSLGVAFNAGLKRLLQYFLLSILSGLAIGLGFIALIVPGIIIAIRLSMAPYFLVDQNMGAIDAMKASWAATRDNSGKVLGIVGVYVLIALPIVTFVGILATLYFGFMYAAAFGALYMYFQAHTSVVAPVAQPSITAAS